LSRAYTARLPKVGTPIEIDNLIKSANSGDDRSMGGSVAMESNFAIFIRVQ